MPPKQLFYHLGKHIVKRHQMCKLAANAKRKLYDHDA